MPTPAEQLLSRTSYVGDGVTTAWNFTFASGYIDQTHVKAYTVSPLGVRTDLALMPGDFIGPYQLSVVPAVVAGHTLVIYRNTPKDAPLVDFADGSNLTEAALDTLARQAVFCAAESEDSLNVVVGPELQATAEAVALAAANAAISEANAATSAAYAAISEANAAASAANAAADVIPLVEAILQPLVDSATASEISAAASAATATAAAAIASASQIAAAASATQAQTSADTATDIATALSGSFGFTNTAYDFGFVSDTTTYLDLDCGVLP